MVPISIVWAWEEVHLSAKDVLLPRLESVHSNLADAEGADDGIVVRSSGEVRRAGRIVVEDVGVGIDISLLVEVQTEEELEVCGVGVVKELADGALSPISIRRAEIEGECIDTQGQGLVDVELGVSTAFSDAPNLESMLAPRFQRKSEEVSVPCNGHRRTARWQCRPRTANRPAGWPDLSKMLFQAFWVTSRKN